MKSKADVLGYLLQVYPGLDMAGSHQDLYWVERECDSGRLQVVYLQLFDDVLYLTSPFAKTDTLVVEAALTVCENYGMVEFSGTYALRQVVLNEELAPSLFDQYIVAIASDADRLERQFRPDADVM